MLGTLTAKAVTTLTVQPWSRSVATVTRRSSARRPLVTSNARIAMTNTPGLRRAPLARPATRPKRARPTVSLGVTARVVIARTDLWGLLGRLRAPAVTRAGSCLACIRFQTTIAAARATADTVSSSSRKGRVVCRAIKTKSSTSPTRPLVRAATCSRKRSENAPGGNQGRYVSVTPLTCRSGSKKLTLSGRTLAWQLEQSVYSGWPRGGGSP